MPSLEHKLTVLSHNREPFTDRIEAGALLAEVLSKWSYTQPVVLGIPRGGLVVAKQVSQFLDADLDIVLTRKLTAPYNPELAIGSVTEDGQVFLDEELAYRVGANERYIEGERQDQILEIQRRKNVYRKAKSKISLTDRTVIVVDDGVATGSTLKAALWSIRKEKPHLLIAALPIGPQNTLEELSKIADEVVCLKVPPVLGAVGQFYLRFDQTTDQQVLDILKRS
jgi:putative phosphoribosyl transferase